MLAILCLVGCGGPQQSVETAPRATRLVDLSYAFDKNTIYWPGNKPFQHEQVAFGRTEAGYWYASFTFGGSEHGGTHLDAPIHFAEGKQSVEQIPIDRHMGPGVKISVADKAAQNRDYLLTAADIQTWEQRMGRIPDGAIVLVHTGWGRNWGNRAQYLGSERDDAADLHFPGIGRDAAEFLTSERRVAMVGIDTASLDHGPSRDFIAHQVLGKAEIPGIENVANLDAVPETGFTVVALPMKIAGGSGGPCRVVAIVNQ
jgi:kynurenine formamidase